MEAFRDCLGRYTALGAERIAVLWPRSSKRELAVLEEAAALVGATTAPGRPAPR
ncbi:hypothetical protein [Paractinoplanes brasiliensis]|uniref:hypothetical protein n=1 Tax=Paractinoplanes brasiliensis TaxID=52695 RepID=UPI001EF1C316|nr:hypothetical protein [Actinoplanes brasiliensis]